MGNASQTEKGAFDPKHIEIVQDDLVRGRAVHYRPQNEDEKRLDSKVNLKLDIFVVSILALEFIVST
jgi:hypothetical protein